MCHGESVRTGDRRSDIDPGRRRRLRPFGAGGLDEDFFCYMEDIDLAFRLRLLGWECLHVPRAVCRHVGSAITGRRSDFSVYHGQRNIVWVFVKNMPPPLFALLLPLHVLLNAAAWFRVALLALVKAPPT